MPTGTNRYNIGNFCLILTACAVSAVVAVSSLTSFTAKAAAPKRLLLVTTTLGFRHAAVPLQEQVIRQMAKSTGEFTIVSTTDSPDFPAAAYQAGVDLRNQRIEPGKAYPNDVPAIAGGFDGPRGTPEQLADVAAMNASLAPLTAAVTSATAALNSAIFSANPNASDIKSRVANETNAELAVANARLEALDKIQSSSAKLNTDQRQALAAAGGGGGRGGPGRGGVAPAETPKPLTDSQLAALSAMNSSLTPLNQAVTAARTALSSVAWADGATPADLKAKGIAFDDAELALANAKAAAFAKIQASPDKLEPAQFQLASQRGGGRGGRGGRGGPGGPDPTTAAVTKVLQQYLNPEALKNYDAIAFLSTTGELPIPDKDAFFKWIADGHGFIGLHSATDTLHQTPEYAKMIGGEFAGHGQFHPKAPVDNMDPASPITAGWGKSIALNEEFYLFRNYDPKQVHLLLAMQAQPYTREAGVYPVSWIKKYGSGRVFYTSLGHRDDVLLPDATIGDQEYKVRFNQAPVALAVQKHILQGVRYALGLIDADATPQAH
jgi:type 1 glutamine amidotransferase